jgi:hypothetical protein
LLILNKGNWDGNQVMTDTSYFRQMTHTSQPINLAYGYLWWLNGTSTFMVPQSQFVFPGPMCPNAPTDMIAAMGKNGQFLNVVNSQELVWLRMGDAPDGNEVPFLMNDQIWAHLNALDCHAHATGDPGGMPAIRIYRTPSGNGLAIESSIEIRKVEISDILGRHLGTFPSVSLKMTVPLPETGPGLIILTITFTDGSSTSRKVMNN